MSEPNEPQLIFPCDMHIKAMGLAHSELRDIVLAMAQKHFPEVCIDNISVNFSKGGKYESITVAIRVQSRLELDSLYAELQAHEKVTMVL